MVTTRSRTLLVLSYRDSNGAYRRPHSRYAYAGRTGDVDDQEREGLISRGDSHVALDMALLFPHPVPARAGGRLLRLAAPPDLLGCAGNFKFPKAA